MNTKKRFLQQIDWISLFLITVLSGIGIFFVFSATYTPEQPYSIFFKKQLFGLCSGLLIYTLCSIIDYRSLTRWGYFGSWFVIGLLVFTLIKGHIGMGAQRWINLGFFKLQPSELAKLLFPAFITHYLYTHKDTFSFSMKDLWPVIATLFISFALILKQPDLGTALILMFSGLLLLWLAGINKKFFYYGAAILLLTAPLSWKILKPYQKKRIAVFLGYGESNKERYQIEQSKIAIGSGGWFGKGFLRGTQNTMQFLPESRTDFIFSVIAEELGFAGVLFVLLLYLALFIRMFIFIANIQSPFTQLLATGLIMHTILSALINIGMVTDLLPIVGIPLPLMSYGLSNLWITFASFGWLNSIAVRRSILRV